MKDLYKVNFSISGLTLSEQQKVFDTVLKQLNYNQRQNFHITVTDSLGGVHNIWENKGVNPSGTLCKNCSLIDCGQCATYDHRRKKNG